MIIERVCKQCGKSKPINEFKSRHHTCISCEEIIEKTKKDNERKRRNKVNNRFRREFNRIKDVLNDIPNYINEGQTNEEMRCLLYNERNPPYDLSNTAEYVLNGIPRRGKTREHINGRETLGTYILHAALIGDIASPQDLHNFYLKYCVVIYTDDAFNQLIKKTQNKSEAAILAADYISVYEDYYKVSLSDDEKNYLREHFISTKYGQITKDDLFNHIRRDMLFYTFFK